VTESYHNSTHARGTELAGYEKKARKQDEQVAELFRKHAPFPLSPSRVHRALGGESFGPLTSVRRAVTNLERAGVLEKLDRRMRGPYGRPEHLWRLKREPEQARLI
jgi:Fe2+ or Zn2+ uptake regulation protein